MPFPYEINAYPGQQQRLPTHAPDRSDPPATPPKGPRGPFFVVAGPPLSGRIPPSPDTDRPSARQALAVPRCRHPVRQRCAGPAAFQRLRPDQPGGANLALVFVLFHGGDGTRRADFQAVALPAGGLVTWGVSLRRFRVVCGVNDRSFLRPPARYRACSPLRDTRAPRHP